MFTVPCVFLKAQVNRTTKRMRIILFFKFGSHKFEQLNVGVQFICLSKRNAKFKKKLSLVFRIRVLFINLEPDVIWCSLKLLFLLEWKQINFKQPLYSVWFSHFLTYSKRFFFCFSFSFHKPIICDYFVQLLRVRFFYPSVW